VSPSNPYVILFSAAAHRGLNRSPAKVVPALIEFITGPLADEPAKLSKPLRNELLGYRSARRGAYRVVIRVDEQARTVLVIRIDHRADVYRGR